MMNKVSPIISMLIVAAGLLVACDADTGVATSTVQQVPEQDATSEIVSQDDAPLPTPTDRPTSQPTSSPLPRPTDTALPSPTPSPTQTPEPTSTPTDIPEPTATPKSRPDVIVEAESVNIRSGPGTGFSSIGAAAQGEGLAVVGQAYGCQWLQIETDAGDFGWVTGGQDYVSLNVNCGDIPESDIPAPPLASEMEPPATSEPAVTEQVPQVGGTGRITVINETPDRGASVFLRTCCENYQISTEPGETKAMVLPADEYAWHVQHHNCVAHFPQLFLTDGMEIIIRFIPIETGCGLYVDVTYIE